MTGPSNLASQTPRQPGASPPSAKTPKAPKTRRTRGKPKSAAATESSQAGAIDREWGFRSLETAKFRIRTLEDADAVASVMANWYSEPEKVARGLLELLYNAIEHGSLEIGHALKGVLLDQGEWREEVERRLAIKPFSTRAVEAVFTRRNGGRYAVITDEGPGFDWKAFLTIDPARAGDRHGRGIAQARAISFDMLSYNDKGNRVAAFVRDPA